MMHRRILLAFVVLGTAVVQPTLAGRHGLCETGSYVTVPVADVPEGLAGMVADYFINPYVGLPYGPLLSCRAFSAIPTQACSQVGDDSKSWQVDAAVTCTDGVWKTFTNDVTTIILRGMLMEPQAGSNETFKVVSATMGVELQPLEPGSGAKPQAGDIVTCDYTLWFSNRTLLQSTSEDGEPIEFPVGVGKVIDGWDQVLPMMRVGESVRAIVRPAFAYGETGAGEGIIPPNATIVSEINLLKIQHEGEDLKSSPQVSVMH